MPVDRKGNDLQRNLFSALLGSLARGVLDSTTARYLHAHHSDAADAVLPKKIGELLGVVHTVKLGTTDECNPPPQKFTVEVPVGKCGAIGGNEQVSVCKIRRLQRDKLDLHWPLGKLRWHWGCPDIL